MMKQTLDGTELGGELAVVVGGTGNVGFFLVDALVRAGAHVLVPTRSKDKYTRLVSRLREVQRERIEPLFVDVGTPGGAAELRSQVKARDKPLRAVVAAPASWHQADSILRAGFADFRHVVETRLFPHFLSAEALLPLLSPEGTYTSINGPAGFSDTIYPGAGSISTVAIAQNRLIQAFAAETGGRPRVNDVVMWAYIGPEGTRKGSALTGEQVGDFVAALSTAVNAHVHGRTIHLKSPEQIAQAFAGLGE